ncbi:MAG: RcpC/CpaB family pilus assembly protein [Acidimicrobiia bacterium]
MVSRRSNQLLFLGLAVFVIGAGIVMVTLRSSDGGDSAAPPTSSTTIQAGTVVVPAATGAVLPTSFTIPEGKQAVAVQVPFVAGLAGYARAGDLVNIYATVEKGQVTPDTPPPVAKLVLPAVEVLAVTGPGPGTGTGDTTYLLALDATQAEQAIFLARFESVWLTLVTKGQPVPSTPGRSYKNAF